jgi:integrase
MPRNRVHKAKDGRYTYSVTDIAGKRHTIISRKNENRPAFVERCNKLDELTAAEIRIETMDELFSAFVEQYLAVYNSKADREVTEQLYHGHVRALIGHKKISDIHRTDVYNVLARALKIGLAPSTIKKIRGCISRPYNWAINTLGLKLTSPTTGLIFRYSKDATQPRTEIRVITPEELTRFFAAAEGTKYENYFKTLILTGLRPSEALGLQVKDVKKNHLEIRRGMTMRGPSTLKTDNARRDIPMTDDLRRVLNDQVNRVAFTTKENWLFPSATKMPSMMAIRSAFESILRNTGTWKRGKRGVKLAVVTPPIEITLIDFRHTFATKMAEAGMPEQTLKTIMGHSDISTTLKYYIGITESMMDSGKKLMENLLQNLLQNPENNDTEEKVKAL